ncbi:MAG: lipid A deacylase LpxR family protein [Bacteroidales bacterium]
MKKSLLFFFILFFFVKCNPDEEKNASDQESFMKKKHIELPSPGAKENEVLSANEKTLPEGSVLIKRRRLRKKEKVDIQSNEIQSNRIIDSTLYKKLNVLRDADIDLDLSEPVNKAYLFSPVENQGFSSMILLSHDRSLKISFDNDIFDNTDRYYTNGIRFDFISPILKQSPLASLMVPYWGQGINYYGIWIGQNMYTPSTTKIGGIHYGDRPYSATLVFGSYKISNDAGKKFRQTSEIDIGIIGPSAFGDFLQKTVHSNLPTNSEPLGWEYQIQNDLILNYNLTYEKGLISTRQVELNANANGTLGTLYTNIGGGFQFRAGLMNPYFGSYGYSNSKATKKEYSKFQIYAFMTSLERLVGYDATLEGGLFNKSSVYTLTRKEVIPLTYQGSLGITLSYEGFRIDFEQFLLSPEFHGCAWHKWGHIGLTIGI